VTFWPAGMTGVGSLPVSAAQRMASVAWLCRQSAYEARALDGSQRQPVTFTYEQVIRNRLPDIDEGLVRRFACSRLGSLRETIRHHLYSGGQPGSLVTERHGFLAAVPLDATAGLPQP
jgi:hypothetical protein